MRSSKPVVDPLASPMMIDRGRKKQRAFVQQDEEIDQVTTGRATSHLGCYNLFLRGQVSVRTILPSEVTLTKCDVRLSAS